MSFSLLTMTAGSAISGGKSTMRSKSTLTAIVAVFVCLHSVAALVGQESDPRSTIEGTLDALIKHLRARQLSDVIRDFRDPEDLEQLLRQATFEQIVASAIGKGDFDRLLTACEHARKTKPQVSRTGMLAVFEYLDTEGKKATFGLKRVGKRWYLL